MLKEEICKEISNAGMFSIEVDKPQDISESYKRMQIWNMVSYDAKKKILQSIGETRWWAKEKALTTIFGSSNDFESCLFVDLRLWDLKRIKKFQVIYELWQKREKTPRRKQFFDEKSRNEGPSNPNEAFKVPFFNFIRDTAVESMKKRFGKNMDVCRKMAILSPTNFINIKNSLVPSNALRVLLNCYHIIPKQHYKNLLKSCIPLLATEKTLNKQFKILITPLLFKKGKLRK
ncbi:unnamed protein product [Brassicogethes aeneus]|uniref:Uncharacterized protein n=1 Tax=Brassicogethes aeneus TaxID=1431903 RepID=A0A9P0FK63_BRAAE|nr:unnamed protein product [Brassicogethes aeneus]